MSNSIPVMRKPADAMSKGLNSSNLAAAAVQRHPIDRMQRGEVVAAVRPLLQHMNKTLTHFFSQKIYHIHSNRI
jgi:hypothetical protein